MTDITLDTYYGGNAPSEELEKVTLLPWDSGRTGVSGTFTAPDGYTWADLEYIEWGMGISGSSIQFASTTNNKEMIENASQVRVTFAANGDFYVLLIYFTSSTEATWEGFLNGVSHNVYPIICTGYKKRYATKNAAKPIILTPENTTGGEFVNGSNIQVNQRYGIDIASVLGAEYVGKDLIIKTEIFNNTGTGQADWFEANYAAIYDAQLGSLIMSGVETIHVKTARTLWVATAGYGSSHTGVSSLALFHTWRTNPMWALEIGNTQCRVTVWTVEQYVTNNTLQLITDLQARVDALENP